VSVPEATTRLDRRLVDLGVARARGEATELIRAGHVTVDGVVVTRPAYAVTPAADVHARRPGPRRVGRGADKLEHALERWRAEGLQVAGRRCLDVGASTGGFTQVLLEEGAAHVTALDVGHGQLADELVRDARVRDLPGTHIADTTAETIGGAVDVLVADLSFIPLTRVLPMLAALVAPEADLVLLVKPQFEVGPGRVGRGGVVRSAEARRDAVLAVLRAAYGSGLAVQGLTPSPIRGGEGNVEYLLWARPGREGMMDVEAALALGNDVTAKEHP
jgi:23S rRNA (cytidine1920-2'-O)/16S rRNA (cytidine1409-2'-O)-methyltransferase